MSSTLKNRIFIAPFNCYMNGGCFIRGLFIKLRKKTMALTHIKYLLRLIQQHTSDIRHRYRTTYNETCNTLLTL